MATYERIDKDTMRKIESVSSVINLKEIRMLRNELLADIERLNARVAGYDAILNEATKLEAK